MSIAWFRFKRFSCFFFKFFRGSTFFFFHAGVARWSLRALIVGLQIHVSGWENGQTGGDAYNCSRVAVYIGFRKETRSEIFRNKLGHCEIWANLVFELHEQILQGTSSAQSMFPKNGTHQLSTVQVAVPQKDDLYGLIIKRNYNININWRTQIVREIKESMHSAQFPNRDEWPALNSPALEDMTKARSSWLMASTWSVPVRSSGAARSLSRLHFVKKNYPKCVLLIFPCVEVGGGSRPPENRWVIFRFVSVHARTRSISSHIAEMCIQFAFYCCIGHRYWWWEGNFRWDGRECTVQNFG